MKQPYISYSLVGATSAFAMLWTLGQNQPGWAIYFSLMFALCVLFTLLQVKADKEDGGTN